MKLLVVAVIWFGVLNVAAGESPTLEPAANEPSTASPAVESHLSWRPNPTEVKASPIEDSGPGFVTLLQALAFCGVVACGGVYLTRGYGKPRGSGAARRLKLVERTALSPKTSLVLVELDGRPFLVSLGQERASITPVDDFQALGVSEEGEECRKVIGFPA